MLVIAGAVLTTAFCAGVITYTFLEIRKMIKKDANK